MIVAVIQEPGIDIVLDPTGDLECCLATALTKAQLRELSTFAPVADQEQLQRIRELCAMWDMDLMLHGLAHVSHRRKDLAQQVVCGSLRRILYGGSNLRQHIGSEVLMPVRAVAGRQM